MVEFLKRDYVRSIYSGYLRGLTYEEIRVKLKLENKGVDDKTIDAIIDDCNAVLI